MNKGEHYAKALFSHMADERKRWDDAVGVALSWERLDGKRVCRIAAYHPFDVDSEASRTEGKAWAVARADKMLSGLDTELRQRGAAVKASLIARGGADEPEGEGDDDDVTAEEPPVLGA